MVVERPMQTLNMFFFRWLEGINEEINLSGNLIKKGPPETWKNLCSRVEEFQPKDTINLCCKFVKKKKKKKKKKKTFLLVIFKEMGQNLRFSVKSEVLTRGETPSYKLILKLRIFLTNKNVG